MEGLQPTSDKQITYDLSKDAAENLYLNGINPVEFIKQFNAFQAEIIAEQLATAQQRAGKRRKMLGGSRASDLLNAKLTALKNAKDPSEMQRIAGEARQIYENSEEGDLDSVKAMEEISRLETEKLNLPTLTPGQLIERLYEYFKEESTALGKFDEDSDIDTVNRTFERVKQISTKIKDLAESDTKISLDVEQQFTHTVETHASLIKKIAARNNEILLNRLKKYGILLAGCGVLAISGAIFLGGAGVLPGLAVTAAASQFKDRAAFAVTQCTVTAFNWGAETSYACGQARSVLETAVSTANALNMAGASSVFGVAAKKVAALAMEDPRNTEGIRKASIDAVTGISTAALTAIGKHVEEKAQSAHRDRQFMLAQAQITGQRNAAMVKAAVVATGAAAAALASGGTSLAVTGAFAVAGANSGIESSAKLDQAQTQLFQSMGAGQQQPAQPNAALQVVAALGGLANTMAAADTARRKLEKEKCGQEETGNAFGEKFDTDLEIGELRAVITGKLTTAQDPEKARFEKHLKTLDAIADVSKKLGPDPDPSKPEVAAKLNKIKSIIESLKQIHSIATAMPQAQPAPPPGAQIGVTAPTGGGGVLSEEDLILGNFMIIHGISPGVVLALMQSRLGASGGYDVPTRARTYRRKTRSGR
jgi:hypothetical protein